MAMTPMIISDDPLDSIVDYECPECGAVYSLEPDAGEMKCHCGVTLDCDVMLCLMEGMFGEE